MSEANGFFGKLPARGDFVRINVAGDEAMELARWLEANLESCEHSQCEVPDYPLYFLYRTESTGTALVGAIAKGQDQVGRVFPSAVFTPLPRGQAGMEMPVLPIVYKDFLAEAATLVEEAQSQSVETLTEKLVSLVSPNPEQFDEARAEVSELMHHGIVREYMEVIFHTRRSARFYALRTLALACDQSRGGILSDKVGITLDCPCNDVDHQVFWLELVHRLLDSPTEPPGLVWTPFQRPRNYGSVKISVPSEPERVGKLLVSFGAAPTNTLALVQGKSKSSKYWPLVTESDKAIESAREALTPQQLRALEAQEQPLFTVVEAFAG